MIIGNIKFIASYVAPKPEEADYWVDICANPYGGVIKYYNGYDWIKLDQASIAEDYVRLRNKPKLNGVIIEGDKTPADYGIPTPDSINQILDEFRETITDIENNVDDVLDNIGNYGTDIAELKSNITTINQSLENIIGSSASNVIDKFNEILSFLDGYNDNQTLEQILSDLKTEITTLIDNVQDDIDLAEKSLTAQINSVQESLNVHESNTNNPHNVTKAQIGLGNVDNTSDTNKPISNATQSALNSITSRIEAIESVDFSEITAHISNKNNPHTVTKTQVGLSNVDNTSDLNKPISTATQTALDTINDNYTNLNSRVTSTGNRIITKINSFSEVDDGLDFTYTERTRPASGSAFGQDTQQTMHIPVATLTKHGLLSKEDKAIIDSVGGSGGVEGAFVPKSMIGQANGVASLDESGLIPVSQLPSYVDDVVEVYATFTKNDNGTLSNIILYSDSTHQSQITGEAGKIYVDITSSEDYQGYQFRWTGNSFAVINASTVIGEVTGTAYDGGKGKTLSDLVATINNNSSTEGSFRKNDADILQAAKEYADNAVKNSNSNITDNYYNKTQADDRFVKKTGDTITGQLTVNSLKVGSDTSAKFVMSDATLKDPSEVIDTSVLELTVEETNNLVTNNLDDVLFDKLNNPNLKIIILNIGGVKVVSKTFSISSESIMILVDASIQGIQQAVLSINTSTKKVTTQEFSLNLDISGDGTKFLANNGTYKTIDTSGNYLPLSGGTMTGNIILSDNITISDSTNNTYIGFTGTTFLIMDTQSASALLFSNSVFSPYGNTVNLAMDGNPFGQTYVKGIHIDGSSDSYVVLAGGGTRHICEAANREGIVQILSDGVMEISSSIDFHKNNTDNTDYFIRLTVPSSGNGGIVYLPSSGGTLALTSSVFTTKVNNDVILYNDSSTTGNIRIRPSGSTASAGEMILYKTGRLRLEKSTEVKTTSDSALEDKAQISFGGHGIVFGDTNTYAHTTYYFRPNYGTQGTTNATLYIQNCAATSSPTVNSYTTTHSFTSDGNATHTGQVNAANGFFETSDIRLKENIKPIDTTQEIQLVEFTWKKNGKKSYGAIAQDVEKYYPELVSETEDGFKNINYDALLVVKVSQMENRIKQLEKELEELKNERNNI